MTLLPGSCADFITLGFVDQDVVKFLKKLSLFMGLACTFWYSTDLRRSHQERLFL